MKPRILLVEDEKSLQEAIKLNLEMENYEVVAVADGGDAVKTFSKQYFNLVVLDVMLPKLNGFEVCQQIRIKDAHTPVLFLTAKDSGADKINGFKKGGDDYLTKPFNLEEFLLRVKVLIKHGFKIDERKEVNQIKFGQNIIDFNNFTAQTANGDFKLSNKELQFLKLLVERKNEVIPRNEILHAVWGYDIFPSTRTVDNFILMFRKYFEKNPHKPKHFHSVRGVGYKFTV